MDFGVDFGENVEFVLIPVCPWAAKSVCLWQNQHIKTNLCGIDEIFFYYMNKYIFIRCCIDLFFLCSDFELNLNKRSNVVYSFRWARVP